MTATELLKTLRALGVEVVVAGDRLGVRGNTAALTSELRWRLKERKAEILAFYRPSPCVVCRNPRFVFPHAGITCCWCRQRARMQGAE